jgi:hypothetical protein
MDNKNIVIFSPQTWSHLKVSKHHYALELSKKNKVLFITGTDKTTFSSSSFNVNKSLIVVEISFPFGELLKFKIPSFYKYIWKRIAKFKIKAIIKTIDLIIDFGCYQQFDSLKFLDASKKIYFPVDDNKFIKSSIRDADYVFSVSENIVNKLNSFYSKIHLINHGLSELFIDYNEKLETKSQNVKVQVGYSGNLFINFLDKDLLKHIIIKNPEIVFNFFGSLVFNSNDKGHLEWNDFLRNTNNIILWGHLETKELVRQLNNQDLFLITYKSDDVNYHSENSHKILEYLSTGKLIFSTPIKFYKNINLFPMLDSADKSNFSIRFNEILLNLKYWNSKDKMDDRKKYACENSYKKQIQRIQSIIEIF